MLWSIYSVYIVIYLPEVSNNSTNHPELHTKPTVSESCEISDWTVTRCEDGQIWLVNQTNQQRFLDFWELVPPPTHHPPPPPPFFSSVTWSLTHWAMIVQWPLPLIKHSLVQAIICALTCVPLAVAMTTASAWSASYSWSDTWMTTLWISEIRPSG